MRHRHRLQKAKGGRTVYTGEGSNTAFEAKNEYNRGGGCHIGKVEGHRSKPRLDKHSRVKKPHNKDSWPEQLKEGGGAKWIAGAIKHKGSLHKALHVPMGEKIPEKKLTKAEHSSNPSLKRKAVLAKTLKGFHH